MNRMEKRKRYWLDPDRRGLTLRAFASLYVEHHHGRSEQYVRVCDPDKTLSGDVALYMFVGICEAEAVYQMRLGSFKRSTWSRLVARGNRIVAKLADPLTALRLASGGRP